MVNRHIIFPISQSCDIAQTALCPAILRPASDCHCSRRWPALWLRAPRFADSANRHSPYFRQPGGSRGCGRRFETDVFGRQFRLVVQHDRPLDAMLQLAHIAWPSMLHEFLLAEAPSTSVPTLYLPEYIFRKCSASKMISSPRSRKGGR